MTATVNTEELEAKVKDMYRHVAQQPHDTFHFELGGPPRLPDHHTAFCLSGQMVVRFDDDTEITISPGDVVNLDPGHSAWTVGDEPCILLDTGVTAYAKPEAHEAIS